jgi:hypothetical protein
MFNTKNGHVDFHTAFMQERTVFEKDTFIKLRDLNPQIAVHASPEIVKETIKRLYDEEILPYLRASYDDLIIDRELELRIKAEISRYLYSKVFVGKPVEME